MATKKASSQEPNFLLDHPGAFASLFAIGVAAVFCGLLYGVVKEANEHKAHGAHADAHGSAAPHASGAPALGSAAPAKH